MAVRLIIEDLEGATTVVNLGTEEVTIGRKPHNTIQLTEQNVSRSHAKLIFQDDGWLIQDLGSYNGVKVNGVPIAGPTLLRESDLIQIGDYHLTLTDDVDRETVDIERPRAANDGAMAMGASAELPSVSVEDLPPMRPPNLAPGDSAAFRSDAVVASEGEKKNKIGIIIGVVGVLAAVVAGGLWIAGNNKGSDNEGNGSDDAGSKIASDDGQRIPPGQDTAAVPPPADTGGTEPVPELDTGEAADAGDLVETDTGEAADADEAADAADLVETDTGELVEEVETDGGDEPDPKPSKTKKTKKRRRPPPEPKLPPDQALAEARKASLKGNNRKAYSLAKDAYDQSKSSEALSVMGIAACKMGSASKAKSAYKKMSGSKDKQMLEKICQPLGIELQ